ncbi:MAG: hypothetical protein NT075_28025 [Chloroflexi bacterium]|nr:hypothetical protein [Chloroflexota bacterium]
MSRTVGLPGLLVDDEWFEPIGGLSVIAEVGLLSSGSSLWRAQNALGNRPVERGCSLARDSLNAKPDEAG